MGIFSNEEGMKKEKTTITGTEERKNTLICCFFEFSRASFFLFSASS